MKVQAAPGTRCPKEGKPREYISDNRAEEVADSAYYLRLVADGSLKTIAEKEAAAKAENKTTLKASAKASSL